MMLNRLVIRAQFLAKSIAIKSGRVLIRRRLCVCLWGFSHLLRKTWGWCDRLGDGYGDSDLNNFCCMLRTLVAILKRGRGGGKERVVFKGVHQVHLFTHLFIFLPYPVTLSPFYSILLGG